MSKASQEKIIPESPASATPASLGSPGGTSSTQKLKVRKHVGPQRPLVPTICNSFQPGLIVDSEERERMAGLAQRDLLIRNYGLLQQVG